MAHSARKRNAVRPADPEGPGPWRRCLVEGVPRPVETMIRFVISPDGSVVPDVAGRLPGRGFWLSARRDTVKTACAKKLFAKAARSPVVVAADFDVEIERLLTRRCLDLIGMARRAGQAVVGFEKVRRYLRGAGAGVVLAAAEGAANGREKIAALAPDVPVIELFSGDELGAALGRQHAVHAVLTPGPIADKLLGEAARLAGFRSPSTVESGAGRVCNTGPDGNANGLK
jgi:hypothetical protein